jgi:hypothetical protein
MSKKKEELKTCPFCSGKNIQTVLLGGLFKTACGKCGSSGGLCETEDISITAWNMRPRRENECETCGGDVSCQCNECKEWQIAQEI